MPRRFDDDADLSGDYARDTHRLGYGHDYAREDHDSPAGARGDFYGDTHQHKGDRSSARIDANDIEVPVQDGDDGESGATQKKSE